MINFRPSDRDIDFLLPPSVQDWLPVGHLARSLACNRHPDHDTLASFRRRFNKEFEAVFVQVLQVARENQLSHFGSVSLDGTKIHANASRHSALSYEHAEAIEVQMKGEVQQLLALAEDADGAKVPDGMSVPEELKRRDDRLAAIAAAKAKIEARAAERFAREQAEYEAKLAARAERAAATGKKVGGKAPQPPTPGPRPKDQINLTDEQSRIMPVACEQAGIEPLIAVTRDHHHPHFTERFGEPDALPANPTPVQRMQNRLKTSAGRAAYALRKQRVEPVFGIIKSVLGQPLHFSPAVWTMFRASRPWCAWRGI